MQHQNEQGDSNPTSPPVEPGAIDRRRSSSWPIVIGVISIVFASLGILSHGCGTISALFVPAMNEFMSGMTGGPQTAQFEAQFAVQERYFIATLVLGAISLGLAIWLLVGGIALVRRRAKARLILMWWAVAKLVQIPIWAIVSIMISIDTVAMLEESAATDPQNATPAGLITMMEVAGVAGTIVWAIVLAAWPVIVLVYLRRAKIRAEAAMWDEA